METQDIRNTTARMNPNIDFDVSMTFYYDETNNIGKLHLEKGNFNVDYTANFVLGGLSYHENAPDVSDMFSGVQFQANINEVKLTHLATGSFDVCLTSRKLNTFLGNVLSKPLYLHFSSLNLFYYSIVDIVDSILPDWLISHGAFFKNVLYVACKRHMDDVVDVFVKYAYPNIKDGESISFADAFLTVLKPEYNDMHFGGQLKVIDKYLRDAAAKNKLTFIKDEVDFVLVDGLVPMYARPIYTFVNSSHIFDEEVRIQQAINAMHMTHSGTIISNYSFLDSKADNLIQASDVLMGLLGKFFKYINTKSAQEIYIELQKFTPLQNDNLDLFLTLFEKTIHFNQGFLHYVDSAEEVSKVAMIGRLRGKAI
jgi:hypothetical protein